MSLKRKAALAAALAVTAWTKSQAMEVSPIYGLQVLGGQNFYSGQRGTLNANASGVVAPALKLDDSWSVLPAFNTNYQGTEQVLDIVGAGTLFQSQWNNRLSVKGVYTPEDSPWRIKPGLSFTYELLQQTKDERLGSGLFDYYKYGAGLDLEYVYHDPFALRFGVDYFQTAFPHYSSLESQAATSFGGQSLAREIVGDRVLDSRSVMATAGGEGPLSERFILDGNAAVIYTGYPEQHIVDVTGNNTAPTRKDVTTMAGLSLKMPNELNSDLRLLGALDVTGFYTNSNQNSFDATQAQFLSHYYSYTEVKAGPSLKVLVGPARNATVFSMSGAYWYRHYPNRPLQDSQGLYLGGSTRMNNWALNASVTYPMAPHFALMFNAQYGRGTSNMHYEQLYKYNYTTSSYMFGFTYDY